MTNEPIMKTLNFARRMEPFVERARLTDKHYDVGDVAAMNVVERSRKGMNQILLRQKISELEAKWAIRETFSIAVNYKLETRRRQQRVLKQKAREIADPETVRESQGYQEYGVKFGTKVQE